MPPNLRDYSPADITLGAGTHDLYLQLSSAFNCSNEWRPAILWHVPALVVLTPSFRRTLTFGKALIWFWSNFLVWSHLSFTASQIYFLFTSVSPSLSLSLPISPFPTSPHPQGPKIIALLLKTKKSQLAAGENPVSNEIWAKIHCRE